MALLAMLSVPALAQCGTSAVASVTYSEGVSTLTASTTASFPWLNGGVDLLPPVSAEKWLNCATWWRLGTDRQVDAGETVSILCSSAVCDVYAFLYHEPPRSSATNGDLPAILPAAEWKTGSCAPRFAVNGAEPRCKMTAFKKMLLDGESTSIPISASVPAMYLVLAVAPGVDCESNGLATQGACEAAEPSLAKNCVWEGGACVDTWCRKSATPGAGNANANPPSYCAAPLDAIASGVELFTTGLDNSNQLIALGATDPHWMVKKDNGLWVPAVYGRTNRYLSGQVADHPFIYGGSSGLPVSRPLAHPDYWFTTGKTGFALGDFSWKQTFDVPPAAVATYSVNYRLGYDDTSRGATVGVYAGCKHAVWVNGAAVVMPSVITPSGGSAYGTSCEGTLSGPWVSGANTIEFRIRNSNTAYGFRFIVIP